MSNYREIFYEAIEVVKEHGGEVVGIGCLIDREWELIDIQSIVL